MKKVLLLGGYGNFGSHIAHRLASDAKISLLIAGRSLEKASRFCRELRAINTPLPVALDITQGFAARLQELAPDIVIHTSGPFQAQGYEVATACIAQGCHYIDLADARSFVANIDTLDAEAREQNVAVISGASSVPCLSSAVADYYLPHFSSLETIDYGISTAQHTPQGLATTRAVLGYAGRPFNTLCQQHMAEVFGWQKLRAHTYPELGRRWIANCDIPDLDIKLFPARYKSLRSISFGAGTELASLQMGLSALSWLVRLGAMCSLAPYAEKLLNMATRFNRWGSDKSGFHMVLSGKGLQGEPLEKRFHLIARSGHGPLIPCIPAIILAKRLARNEAIAAGARACMGLISLPEYLAALNELDITAYEDNQPMKAASLST